MDPQVITAAVISGMSAIKMKNLRRWFQQGVNAYTKQEDWLFTGEYWNRHFVDNPDIF